MSEMYYATDRLFTVILFVVMTALCYYIFAYPTVKDEREAKRCAQNRDNRK